MLRRVYGNAKIVDNSSVLNVINSSQSPFHKFKNSFLSTIIAESIMLPITTIKTVYQTTKNKSILHTTKNIYQQRGIKGFYRSAFPSILSQSISTSTKFMVYYSVVKCGGDNLFCNILSSLLAGIVACSVVHPINVIKQHQERGLSFIERLNVVGPKLFYRGYTKGLLLSILLTLSFPVYDQCKKNIANTFLAAAVASIIITTLVQPIDLLKIRGIAAKRGYYRHYRGFHINLVRSVPHFVITMSFIEYFQTCLIIS